jgi:hypothetical protein
MEGVRYPHPELAALGHALSYPIRAPTYGPFFVSELSPPSTAKSLTRGCSSGENVPHLSGASKLLKIETHNSSEC